MSVGGGVAPSVLETLEFPAALALVAEHAAGPLGAARVRARRPLTDAGMVRAALADVAEVASLILADAAVSAEPVPDLDAELDLLAVPGSVFEGAALVRVATALIAARTVHGLLGRLAPEAPRAAERRVPLPPREVDTRLAAALDAEGAVKDGASKELARARRAVRETRERLVARLESILAGLDPTDRGADAVVTMRNGRYVIPVRSTGRTRVGGIVHDASATRATVFVEPPEVIELGNELRACEVEEQRETQRVLRDLTELVRPHHATLAAAWEMCVAFDDLVARARYAAAVNGFAPAVGEGPLRIRHGRHPLLVASDLVVVPFDLELAGDEWTVLVSGPNTGGKTVLMKAVGLLCLLAQAGVIPPLGPESRLPVWTTVFADVGDRQSIAASLSTFSAHARVLVDVLAGAGPGTLVLLDEIGSGTDPAEGGALAAAVLRELTRRRAVTLATTHLGALKRLAAETVGIVNGSLQFDAETLTPSYRFVKGVPGRSYGLAIARRLGVPGAVLEDAQRAVPDAERTLDALLAEVEARARDVAQRDAELREARAALDDDQARVDARGADVESREQAVRARERELESAAREQARRYLLEARKQVERALGQARAAVDEATAREARRLVEEAIKKEDGRGLTGSDTGVGGFVVGDRARLGEGRVGTVREVRHDGTVVLETGNVRVQVPAHQLRPVGGEAAPAARAVPAARSGPGRETETSAATEVDLRGLRVEEVDAVLLRALDDAVLADLPSLRIIHGKGTGAVRARVTELLDGDPRVAHFAPAPANQGGAGVTIADIA